MPLQSFMPVLFRYIPEERMCGSCSHLGAIFKYSISDLSIMCSNESQEHVIKFNYKNGSYHGCCKNLAGIPTHTYFKIKITIQNWIV